VIRVGGDALGAQFIDGVELLGDIGEAELVAYRVEVPTVSIER
jgi:hypothetical protein